MDDLSTKKIIKLVALNLSIVVINIIIFSKGIIGISLSTSNAFKAAIGFTVIGMSVIVFIYGNYVLLIQKPKINIRKQLKTIHDYIELAEQLCSKQTFKNDLTTMIKQLKRLDKKKNSIEDILLQNFKPNEISYLKFHSTVLGVEEILFSNIRSILNKINAFDQEEYDYIKSRPRISDTIMQKKLSVYNEYITYVRSSLDTNEEIIVKLDMLLLEISKFNSLDTINILEMIELKELEELINQTKLYK